MLVDGVDLDGPDIPPGFKEVYLAAAAEDARREAAEHDPWLMRTAARWYVQHLRWPVFPCVVGTKKPATKNGFKDATLDLAQVDRWWPHGSQAPIGTPTGHTFDAIDIDLYRDWTGYTDLKAQGLPPILAWSLTGGGGFHLLITPNPKLTNGSNLWPGVDIRATGGYIVLPPSRHPSGERYRWHFDHTPGPDLAGSALAGAA
ncbi:bifunctional DNA primase/polymerase [Parafrankia sp. FMc6]|uniref:bifunctional DNA primase/polymerase n=1 Tax=Parafrankia soli TaxID=2599596 RepID=UPI0034D75D95